MRHRITPEVSRQRSDSPATSTRWAESSTFRRRQCGPGLHLRYYVTKLLSVGSILPQSAFFQHDETIGLAEIFLVMTDDKKGLFLPLQFRNYFVIKLLPEQGVLVCGPLVKNIDWLVFQAGRNKCKTFPLSLRKIDGGKDAIFNSNLVIQAKLLQIIRG